MSDTIFSSAIVVEPNAKVRKIVSGLVSKVGIEKVVSCDNPVEAAGMIATNRCDLVLCGSAFGAGKALAQALRWSKDSPRRDITIVLMAKADDLRALETARDLGIDTVIFIPFGCNALFQRLEAVAASSAGVIETAMYVGPDRRRASHAFTKVERRSADPAGPAGFEKNFREILRDHILQWKAEHPDSVKKAAQPSAGIRCSVDELREGMFLINQCETKGGLSIVSSMRPLSKVAILRIADMVRAGEVADVFHVLEPEEDDRNAR